MNTKLFAAGILSALLAVGATGITTSFAQLSNDTSNQTSTQTASSGNATSLSGAIASLQNNEAGAPAWITSGHWTLESNAPVFGDNSAEIRVSNFSAVIYMTSIANGTNTHKHEIMDFQQTQVLHSSQNVTTVNGTFTISMSDGPHQNTSGYIKLQNDMISLWVDPTGIDEHFGPTPIYGLIVPEHFKADDSWKQNGTSTAGNMTVGPSGQYY